MLFGGLDTELAGYRGFIIGELNNNEQTRIGKRLSGYCLNISGGPLTRLPLRSTVTSTRSAILMNGMPLFIP
jgi:hypothetical protein